VTAVLSEQDIQEAERVWRRAITARLTPEDLAENLDYWARQRALLLGDLAAGDFLDTDETAVRGGIAYAEHQLAELARQAERHTRAMHQPGYPPARVREDPGPRFAAARYADLVGLAETLTAQVARKCGTRYRIVCPFHAGDRDPSLVIYPPGKGWHCFGCGRGGDAVTFCMEFFHTGVVEALLLVEQLANTDPEAWGAAS
jgi:hypothetical protein